MEVLGGSRGVKSEFELTTSRGYEMGGRGDSETGPTSGTDLSIVKFGVGKGLLLRKTPGIRSNLRGNS